MVSINRLKNSFRHAWHGFKNVLVKENTFRVMLIIAFLVILLTFILPLTKIERTILIILCLIVLGFELFNTLFEKTIDFFNPSYDERIKDLKDMAAAIVLFISILVGILALYILLPYLLLTF